MRQPESTETARVLAVLNHARMFLSDERLAEVDAMLKSTSQPEQRVQAGELLPCPFCGGNDLDVTGRWVTCNNCTADGPCQIAGQPGPEAIAAWNTRASFPEAGGQPMGDSDRAVASLGERERFDKWVDNDMPYLHRSVVVEGPDQLRLWTKQIAWDAWQARGTSDARQIRVAPVGAAFGAVGIMSRTSAEETSLTLHFASLREMEDALAAMQAPERDSPTPPSPLPSGGQGEPVAWRYRYHAGGLWHFAVGPADLEVMGPAFEQEPLYATQPPAGNEREPK